MVHSNVASDEVLMALLEYMLEIAPTHSILRIFAKVEEEIPELELFQRAGFQRYARELTYIYEPQGLPPGIDLPSLRRWNRHHVWGLHQLYRSVTPQRVQMAELLENSEEFAQLYVGSLRRLPFSFSRGHENYVCDLGVRLGAWLQVRRGYGSAPHQISLIVHPEHAELAEPLLKFGVGRALEGGIRRIYCQVREYESAVIAALRSSNFEQAGTRVLLVRHMALLAMNPRTVPALEQRVVYGVRGLGTVNSRQTQTTR